jgi:hypothetical protein
MSHEKYSSFFDSNFSEPDDLSAIVRISKELNKTCPTGFLFDNVAPIAIYHFADISYKAEAMNAFKKLQRYDDLLPSFIVDAKSIDDIDTYALKNMYNCLFAYEVEKRVENCTFSYDEYNSFYYLIDNEKLFEGDDTLAFAWYENANAIKDRLDTSLQISPR